jgi:hypothetical protein
MISLWVINIIIVECFTDEFLVRLLGFSQVKHESGKGKVLKSIRNKPGAIGIIDEDPDSDQPKERKEYFEIESGSQIKLLTKRDDESKKVIQICPRLEEWILDRAKQNHVSPRNFGLSNDPNDLHIPHIERRKNFQKFMKEIIEKDDVEMKMLKKWLMTGQ